jgi:hypothetical protein
VKRYVGRPVRRGIADPLPHNFGAAVGWVYKLAFGGFDEFAYRQSRKAFIAEVEQTFSDLFSRRAGRVVPDEGTNLPRAFDYVAVTVEFEEVRIRIIRGREELRVQAASPDNPQDWQDLSLLWHRKAMRECDNPPSCHDQLGEVVQRLDNCWKQLIAALGTWQ